MRPKRYVSMQVNQTTCLAWSASGTHPALSNEDPIACNNRPSSVAARGSIDAEIDLMKSQQERQMGDGAF